MSKDYVQQAGMNKDVRVDGKRVAGKLRFYLIYFAKMLKENIT